MTANETAIGAIRSECGKQVGDDVLHLVMTACFAAGILKSAGHDEVSLSLRLAATKLIQKYGG